MPRLRKNAGDLIVHRASKFLDIGALPGYTRANLEWLEATGKAAFVGAGATVAGTVRLVSSVVGAGARVTGRGALERCVVWPGATAEAPLAGVVVTTAGVVRVPPQ